MKIFDKIVKAIREVVFVLSIITTAIGLFFLFMGIVYFWFRDVIKLEFITDVGDWNAYILLAGLVIFSIGIWYLYSYLKNRKFVLKELRTNKRSELLKRHNELRITVKHMPSKYQKMLRAKEEELRIK